MNGRTDSRTDKPSTTAINLTLVDAGRSADRLATIGDVLNLGIFPTEQRHPVIRTGERAPIAQHVRTAVWYRDQGRCELCATHRPVNGVWHLDHITPWSAGGTDKTSNLRLLCEMHNMNRGNKVDPTERPRRAVTWWCVNCYSIDGPKWKYDKDGFPTCPRHVYTSERLCSVARNYKRWLELDGAMPTWHQRSYIEDAHVVAFCAHCQTPALTDQPL